ncbi:MAG: NADH-quinone oxidoreductase subunit NuoE [Bacillota bacterium]|nr:NADH-quinone oxidoreductase subunit NuoE [Bacillota bacterium]
MSIEQAVELALLDPVLEAYGSVRGSTISILQQTQELYGYLPKPALTYISQRTGIPEAKLFGVATFYAQFRTEPVGKHLVMLCQGTACHVNGADAVQQAIMKELGVESGGTTSDGIFTFLIVACLGCCSLAPAMMVDEETHAKLTPESAVKTLREIAERSRA